MRHIGLLPSFLPYLIPLVLKSRKLASFPLPPQVYIHQSPYLNTWYLYSLASLSCFIPPFFRFIPLIHFLGLVLSSQFSPPPPFFSFVARSRHAFTYPPASTAGQIYVCETRSHGVIGGWVARCA